MIALLNIIFGSKPIETKLELLSQTHYHIKITQDIKKEVSYMDFYGAYREEKGRQLGREEGRQLVKLKQTLAIIHRIHKFNPDWSFEFILDDIIGVNQEKRNQYLKALTNNMKSESEK